MREIKEIKKLEDCISDDDAKKFAKKCPACGRDAELRINWRILEVWACGCWHNHEPIYKANQSRNAAIKAWNDLEIEKKEEKKPWWTGLHLNNEARR